MSLVLRTETKFEVEVCCACQMQFAMTAEYQLARRRDHGFFFCPAGHRQHYLQQSDVEKARAEAAEQKRRREEAELLRDQAEAAAAKAQGQLRRTKQRIAGGVCPCCKRSFKALANHMAHKHPGFQTSG